MFTFFKIKGDSALFLNKIKEKKGAVPFNQKGSLLIEILLVVVILSVSLTLIVQSLLSSLQVVRYNAEYSKAVMVLDNKLVQLMQYKKLDSFFKDDNEFLKEENGYQYTLEEEEVEQDGKITGLTKIKLGVSWPSGNKKRILNLSTYSFILPKKN
ncbi:hypothetical protein MNBD_UNCLBAC01-978 [hydrothermal vent metagenome]|uniref:Uncharacterized protein n=1 Tax=hydrothermal vent metagenome TaxID=652676 RepID=A0A3B1DJ98_9ZZZZ